MEVRFNPKTSELVDLHLFFAWQAPWHRQQRRRLGFLLPISFLLFSATFFGAGEQAMAMVLVAMAGLWLLFHRPLMEWRIRQFATGYYNHPANERHWAERHYRFAADGIHLTSEYATTHLQWKAIQDRMEREDAFWLFETMTTAHPIPKRALDDVDGFRTLLQEHLGKE